MKRSPIIALVLIALGSIALWHYKDILFISKCDKLYTKYSIYVSSINDSLYLNSSLYRMEINDQLSHQRASVAFACIDDKPHRSIILFDSLISVELGPDNKRPSNSAKSNLISSYYNAMALAYENQGDKSGSDKAKKQSKRFASRAKKSE